MAFRILVSDAIDKDGVELLKNEATVDVKTGLKPEDLISIIGDYEGLIVRSQTKVTAEIIEAGHKLQVIGRAGVGVDNIDLEAATRNGIAVVNAPVGNTIAAAEHTVALLLALARNVPQANASLKAGQWKRSAFTGVEVRGKTIGIIGLGKVGSEVAGRLRNFQTRLLGYDPYISPEYARTLGIELVSVDDILERSDFITLHVPLTDATRNLIGEKQLAKVKPSVRIINVARGGLIDEDALHKALEEGRVAGAAVDVFTKEPPDRHPLIESPKVIATPHLGASTAEAQRDVAIEVAEQALAVLNGQPARYTVNAPFIPPEVRPVLMPYIQVATYIGKMATQLAEGQISSIDIHYEGDIAEHDTVVLKSAALIGLLAPVTEERINLVNASLIASQRGLKVVEHKKSETDSRYGGMISVELTTSEGTTIVGGTAFRGESHIIRIDDYWLDIVASSGYVLCIRHHDRPGMIGTVGTISGKNDINISFMEVGRLAPRGNAVMMVGLDDPMPDSVLEEIRAIPHIYSARVVAL